MGGGGPSQTTNQSYPPWAVPFAGNYLGGISGLVNQDLSAGYNPNFNQQIQPFSPFQQQGFGTGASAAGFDPQLLQPTQQNYIATQQGKFLDPATNPWLTSTFEMAAAPVSREFRDATEPGIQAEMARAGSFGGSAQQDAEGQAQLNLGSTLKDLGTSIYGGNYAQERQNQLAQQQGLGNLIGAGFAPSQELLSLGGQQQQQGQNILDAFRQNALQKFQYPFDVWNQLGSAIQSAVGGQGSTTIKSGGKGLF